MVQWLTLKRNILKRHRPCALPTLTCAVCHAGMPWTASLTPCGNRNRVSAPSPSLPSPSRRKSSWVRSNSSNTDGVVDMRKAWGAWLVIKYTRNFNWKGKSPSTCLILRLDFGKGQSRLYQFHKRDGGHVDRMTLMPTQVRTSQIKFVVEEISGYIFGGFAELRFFGCAERNRPVDLEEEGVSWKSWWFICRMSFTRLLQVRGKYGDALVRT